MRAVPLPDLLTQHGTGSATISGGSTSSTATVSRTRPLPRVAGRPASAKDGMAFSAAAASGTTANAGVTGLPTRSEVQRRDPANNCSGPASSSAALNALGTTEASAHSRSQTSLVQPPPEPTVQASRKRPLPPSKDIARTFGPTQWLSDDSIGYVYSLREAGDIEHETSTTLRGAQTSVVEPAEDHCTALPETVLLIDPATAFWLTVEEDPKDLDAAKKALRLHERELVLCPMTDNRDGSRADAGSHWSLLVAWSRAQYSKPTDTYFRFAYYDTLSGGMFNNVHLAQAQTLACRLAGHQVQVYARPCPQQTNTWDCGVYVLLFSDLVLQAFLKECATSTGGSSSPSSNGSASERLHLPWEEALSRVTPKQVADQRMAYYKRFSAAAVYAAGGA